MSQQTVFKFLKLKLRRNIKTKNKKILKKFKKKTTEFKNITKKKEN